MSSSPPKKRRWRWLWITLLVLVVLITLPFIVGLFLPENYRGEVKLTLDKSPEEVWEALNNPSKYPLSGQMCKGVKELPSENGLPTWEEDMGESVIRVETVESESPSHLKLHLADSVVPMTAVKDIHIEKTDNGSRITTSNDVTIGNEELTWHVPLFRVIMTLTNGAESGPRDYWQRIAKGLDAETKFEDE